MTLLEVRDLRTQFPTARGVVKAVDGVDLTIEKGEIVGLVGESGSGKSVLAQSILGIVDSPGRIAGGDIRLDGESLLRMSERERADLRGGRVSMIFQDPMNSLNPTLTVGEQIAETVRLHQDVDESVSLPAEIKRKILGATKDSESWRRAIEMLEAVEIPDPAGRATDYPHEFSGGMRQRAMIAMALSCEPDLLVADEPTTALDVTVQAQILDELAGLKEEFDTSILLITHDLAVVAETCDRVNVMYAGEIVERAPADELFDTVETLNDDPDVHGILVQMPVPDHVDKQRVLRSIDPVKDVDGFHPENVGRLVAGDARYKPATPHGIQKLLAAADVETEGKDAVVVGRSDIVGKPMANLLIQKAPGGNATTTVCHSRTADPGEKTRNADIVIAAVGVPEFIDGSMIQEGAAVIDVGVNRVEADTEKGYELVGDVEFESAREKAGVITPVPGGVGPMTITMLLYNTVKAASLQEGVQVALP